MAGTRCVRTWGGGVAGDGVWLFQGSTIVILRAKPIKIPVFPGIARYGVIKVLDLAPMVC